MGIVYKVAESDTTERLCTHAQSAVILPYIYSMVGYRPQGRKEPDMTEATQHACTLLVYLLVLNCSKESSSWIEEFAIGELLS